jgi:hypothetical protein
MNCQDFQEQLFEYLDGTLPAVNNQEIEQHLASCLACREYLAKHQQLAKKISDHLCQSVESLALDRATRRRVLASVPTRAALVPRQNFLAQLWPPLAWVTCLACLLAAGFILSNHFRGTRLSSSGPRLSSAAVPVSVRVARVEATYTFRAEGGFVTDALVCRTNFVEQTLWADAPSKPLPKGSANKLSL